MLDAALADRTGPFNVVSRRGHATMASLLQACHTVAGGADARLTWIDAGAGLLLSTAPPRSDARPGPIGLDPARERSLLDAWHGRSA